MPNWPDDDFIRRNKCGMAHDNSAHTHDLLHRILNNQERIMAAIDDLNTEVSTVVADEAAIKTDLAAVLAELTAAQGQSSPDLSGAIAKLTALHASLGGDDASLKAAEPAPAPATPTATS